MGFVWIYRAALIVLFTVAFSAAFVIHLSFPQKSKPVVLQNAGGAVPGWSRASERHLQQRLFLYQNSPPAGQIPEKQIESQLFLKKKKRKRKEKKKKRQKSPSRLIHSRVASGTCVEGRLDLRGDFICFPLLSACSKESLEIFELLFINTKKKKTPKPQPQTNPKL